MGARKGLVFIYLYGWFLKTIFWYVVERSQGNKPNVFIHFKTLHLFRTLYIMFNIANEKKTQYLNIEYFKIKEGFKCFRIYL